MISSVKIFKRIWSIQLLVVLGLTSHPIYSQILAQDPKWNQFVVGKIDSIPHTNVRNYLIDARDNNPYGKQIVQQLSSLGPFAPAEGNVFWLPHIEVPENPENWRFLASLQKVSPELQPHAFKELNGKRYIRIFVHPYSTEQTTFKKIAQKFGGFKYEYQAATTASPRSFVSWKATNPDPNLKPNTLNFPNKQNDIFRTKVSIYKLDVDGSRLNPEKKMVRAASVSHFFDAIPAEVKEKINFDFESESFVAVPDGTDAGYVLRNAPTELSQSSTSTRVEPAFSVLRPERLDEIVGNKKNPLAFIIDKLFKPISTVTTYLLLEEGLMGEFHSQNYEYVVDSKGVPTGKLIIHDADSFRSNLGLRALNKRDLSTASLIDNPFFYLKDSVHQSTQSSQEYRYTLQSLLEYISDPDDETSFVRTIYDWCVNIKKYNDWCQKNKIKKSVLDKLAQDFSIVLGRNVSVNELNFDSLKTGKIGLIAIMEERMLQIASKFNPPPPSPEIQKVLQVEFEKLVKMGQGKSYGTHTLNNSQYHVERNGNILQILVIGKSKNQQVLKGLAFIDPHSNTPETNFIMNKLKNLGLTWNMNELSCKNHLKSLHGLLLPRKPVMRNMGGGNNVN